MKKHTGTNLGQNFLINRGIANKIIDALFPITNTVVEIGPGKGMLTNLLIDRAKENNIQLNLILIELDEELVLNLKEKNKEYKIINKSILNIKPDDFCNNNFQLIGNVPYYISKDIIDWVILNYNYIESGVLMFQKEFVEKLLYPNEPKDINSQNMIFKYLFKANKIISVSPGSFFPIPKINSAVFKFEKKIGEQIEGKVEKDPVIDIKDFYNFIKACFNKRRKTLLNNLLNYYRGNNQIIAQILKEENIKINIRAEELKISDFTNIYKKIINLNLPLKP